MKQKSLTLGYAVIQFTFWTCFAGIVAFSSYFLLARGLNNTQIGTIIALGGLTAAVVQPVVGILMDRFKALTSPRMMILVMALSIGSILLLFLLPNAGLLVTGLLYGVMILVAQLGQSVLNVVGVDSMAHGNKLNFNLARAFGSFGYAVAAWAIGQLTGIFPPNVLLIVILTAASILIVTCLIYPMNVGTENKQEQASAEALGPVAFLKKYPMFALLLPALVMIYFSHAVLNTFTLQIMNSFGAGSEEMGVSTALAAMFELVTVVGFAFYRKHFKIGTLLRVSGVFFLLKAIFSLLANTVILYYGAQLCQMFAWGIMCIGLVYYVNEMIPDTDRAKGQTYTGMTLTVANVIGGVTGGKVIDDLGIRALLIMGIAVCAVGCILLFMATRKKT